jgi:uncharacterized protein
MITIAEINIFPVKSLRGISVQASKVTSRGLQFDRRFMLVDEHHEFLTQRERPQMATIATAIDGERLTLTSAFGDTVQVPLTPPPAPTRTVKVWSSHVHAHTVAPEADLFLSEHLGEDVRLVYMPDSAERRVNPAYAKNGEIVSFADGYPVLIASMASLEDLNARIAKEHGAGQPTITMDRFRANIVVTGCGPFGEDGFGDFAAGSAAFRAVKPCTRCQVTTTDQRSGEVLGPEPLRTLTTFRDSPNGVRFGMNLLVSAAGEIRVGDTLKKK